MYIYIYTYAYMIQVILRWMVHSHGPLLGLCFALSVLSLVLFGFFSYHLSLVWANTTTNETFKWQDLRRHVRHKLKVAAAAKKKAAAATAATATAVATGTSSATSAVATAAVAAAPPAGAAGGGAGGGEGGGVRTNRMTRPGPGLWTGWTSWSTCTPEGC